MRFPEGHNAFDEFLHGGIVLGVGLNRKKKAVQGTAKDMLNSVLALRATNSIPDTQNEEWLHKSISQE